MPTVKQVARVPSWGDDQSVTDPLNGRSTLAFGRGRSYGDSCLNSDGSLIDTRALDRFIAFDQDTGCLQAEPGVTLSAILSLIVPAGWFLPVSPGTAHVTLGGAVANDVHGKNHHQDGTIGRFVRRLQVRRSTGEQLSCSADEQSELLAATIGGLGLTGLITVIELQLIPIDSPMLTVATETFTGLAEFADLSARYRDEFRYTVAWLDCASSGTNFANGIFLAANHVRSDDELAHRSSKIPKAGGDSGTRISSLSSPGIRVPFHAPAGVLNATTIKLFNRFYYWSQSRRAGVNAIQHYRPFFYPLDAIGHWNRIYGRGGFHQVQFVVPTDALAEMEKILRRIVASGMGSFLAVLKEFGDLPSPGLMSFPRPGFCLALDFANRGSRTINLIREIEAAVCDAGGALYPAKDRVMTRSTFEQSFPRLPAFLPHVDPGFSSDFWKRVHG